MSKEKSRLLDPTPGYGSGELSEIRGDEKQRREVLGTSETQKGLLKRVNFTFRGKNFSNDKHDRLRFFG